MNLLGVLPTEVIEPRSVKADRDGQRWHYVVRWGNVEVRILSPTEHPSEAEIRDAIRRYIERLYQLKKPPEVLRFEIELQDTINLGDGSCLRRKSPLLARVEWDTDGLHWSAPDISYVDLAENYQELITTANAMCVLLWQEYALADDANLTEDARQLKQRMLRDFEVIECK